MQGTIARSPAFREDMLSRIRDVEVPVGGRIQSFPALAVPDSRVDPFVVRVTKGLLAHFHPEVEYGDHVFEVRFVVPDTTTLSKLAPLLRTARMDHRGDGVFRVLHAITDTLRGGFWLQGYYQAVWYLVLHRRDTAR